jgi:hypothetical protein
MMVVMMVMVMMEGKEGMKYNEEQHDSRWALTIR